MIAFFLTYEYDDRGKCHGAKAHRYDGTITFVGGSSTVFLGTTTDPQHSCSFATAIRRNKVTIFDDSCAPPKLIREDYPIKRLRKFKYLKLPTDYIDERGDIVSAKGYVIFSGPKHL